MIEQQREQAAQPAGTQQHPSQRQEQQGGSRPETVLANLPSTDNWVIKGIVPGRADPPRRR